jgi:hypothetical protein
VLRETTSRGLCGLGVCVFITAVPYLPNTKLCAWGDATVCVYHCST